MMTTVTFHGAAQQVTGSCHLVSSPSCGRVLLDCGMHQGGDAVKRMSDESFPFSPPDIDAVILSHAHLDHSGLLPRLYAAGFRGVIYCTRATEELLEIMLKDSAGLYLRDIERINLRNARRGRPKIEPEYTKKDVEKVLKLCDGHSYGENIPVGESAILTLHDAGHILGSSIIEIKISERGTSKTLVFSGDLGKSSSALMNTPSVLTRADMLMVESTYGDREHRTEEDSQEELYEILKDTMSRGGNVLIPAFAVGRTQDILFHLGSLHHQGRLDQWEIFLDSPMAVSVTKVYDRWLSVLDDEYVRALDDAQKSSLESFLPRLNMTVDVEESMAINRIKSGAIIIAGSGMCTGGRIRHHFKQRIWDDRNVVLFTGFQARGTLGRVLVDGAKTIKMFGHEYVVKSRVETLGGLSAHAGQSGLVNWIGNFKPPAKTVLVHGEPDAQDALAQRLWQEQQLDVAIPGIGESLCF